MTLENHGAKPATRDKPTQRTWQRALTALAALADWVEREAIPAGLVDALKWRAFLRRLWPALRGSWSARTHEEIESGKKSILDLMERHQVYDALATWLSTMSPVGSTLFSSGAGARVTCFVWPLQPEQLATIRATLTSMLLEVESMEPGSAAQGQEASAGEQPTPDQDIEAVEESTELEWRLRSQEPEAEQKPPDQGAERIGKSRHLAWALDSQAPRTAEKPARDQDTGKIGESRQLAWTLRIREPGTADRPALDQQIAEARAREQAHRARAIRERRTAERQLLDPASGKAAESGKAAQSEGPQRVRAIREPEAAKGPAPDHKVEEVKKIGGPLRARTSRERRAAERQSLVRAIDKAAASKKVAESGGPQRARASDQPSPAVPVGAPEPSVGDAPTEQAQNREIPAGRGESPREASRARVPPSGRVSRPTRRPRRRFTALGVVRTPRMAMRSLLARPSRTLLTAFGIILGVSVVVAVSITNHSTLTSLNAVFGEVSGNCDLMVMSSTVDGEGFAEEARWRVASLPGVKTAAPSIHAHAVLAGGTSERELEADILGSIEQYLMLYGVDPRIDPEVRVYKMVEGEWLHDDPGLYEVVLVNDLADEEEIKLGDDLPLVTPNGIELVRVVGLMSKEGAGQLNNGMFGVMSLAAVQEMFNRAGGIDQIDVIASEQTNTTQRLETLRDALRDKLGESYSVTFPASQGERVSQMLEMYQLGLGMFGAIAVFVGTFLIYNAFSMTVIERTREFGMLRTIGMTRGQIVRQMLAEAIMLGAVSSGLGVGGGILLAGGLIRAMAALLAESVPETTIPTSGLVSGVAVGIVATLLAALIPARRAGQVSPLEALRIRARHKEGWLIRRGWMVGAVLVAASAYAFLFLDVPAESQFQVMYGAMFGLFTGATLLTPLTVGPWELVVRPFVRGVFGREGKLGGSNIRRARMRTTMTVTALMVGVAMLMSIRAVSASFQVDLGEWIEGYVGGDLVVYSAMPMQLDFGGRLEAIEGVSAAAPSRTVQVKVKRPDGSYETLAMNVVDPVKHVQVGSFTFTATMGDAEQSMARFAAGDAVFLSTLIADRYGMDVGDMLTIQTRRGIRDFEVAGVVVDFMEQGMAIEGSWRDMRQYFRIDDASSFWIGVEPGYDPKDIMATIERVHGTRRNLGTFSNEVIKEAAMGISAQTSGLFAVMSWIALIVATLGVVNTLLMNVMERTREIGMLRGMGMTRWQVVKMVLAEAAVMGTIGGALGIGVGTILSRLFVISANEMQGYTLKYVMPTEALVFAFVVAVGVSQVAALWPSGRAARLRIVEAIQFE